MNKSNTVNYAEQQELNRSLTNILNNSIDQNVLNNIRDLDPNSIPQIPTILPPSIAQQPNPMDMPVRPMTTNRSLPKANPLHANAGLYFRDILKHPEESVSISQSIRTRGTRFDNNGNNLRK
jgi:hypothetical protein